MGRDCSSYTGLEAFSIAECKSARISAEMHLCMLVYSSFVSESPSYSFQLVTNVPFLYGEQEVKLKCLTISSS